MHAFVLAGGRSTRMGRDKALLEFAGKKAIQRTYEVACRVAENVSIVGDPERFERFGATIKDVFADRGPLGGIHAALSSTSADLNVMVAVDLPHLTAELLAYIVSQARSNGATVTVPRIGGRLQPLCAVYRKEFAAVAEQGLANGENKIDVLFSQIPTQVIEEPELLRNGFSAAMFANINTPDEYEMVLRQSNARET